MKEKEHLWIAVGKVTKEFSQGQLHECTALTAAQSPAPQGPILSFMLCCHEILNFENDVACLSPGI